MSDMVDEGLAELDRQLGIEPDESGAPDEGGTPEPEPAGERARDPETGQFVKTEPEEPGAETEGEPQEELILGRFKNHDEVVKAYEELDREFGRRNQQWDAEREEREQLRAALQSQQPQYQLPQVDDDLIETDPVQAMEIAYAQARQTGDPTPVRRVAEAWDAVVPGASRMWAQNKMVEQQLAQVQAQLQPVQAHANQNDMDAALRLAASELPDLDKHLDQILEAAQNAPEVLQSLMSTDIEGKKRIIANLYKIARYDTGRQNDEILTTAQQEAARQQQTEAQAAKKDAFVGAGSVRNDTEAVSEDEQWLREFFDPAAKRYMADE